MTARVGPLLALAGSALSWAWLQIQLRFQEDAALARRLQARDAQAMGELYDRYGRLAYSLIFRMVRNAPVTEDLVQETFLRVWNRVQSFDPERGAFGPWILTVARNRAIDHLRSASARSNDVTVELDVFELDRLEQPARFLDAEESVLSADRSRRLMQAFERLTPNQKAVIEMAYFEGLSQTEMAERMQQPLGTVKTWARTALKALREELGSEAALA